MVRATVWLLEAWQMARSRRRNWSRRPAAAGIGERTLEKAKGQLGIESKVSFREGVRRWLWCPPPNPLPVPSHLETLEEIEARLWEE